MTKTPASGEKQGRGQQACVAPAAGSSLTDLRGIVPERGVVMVPDDE
jgi:hypothetical protein